MDRVLPPTPSLSGTLRVPGDKSVTHRALMLAALAEGTSRILHPLKAGDTRSTARVLAALGAEIVEEGPHYRVRGVGLHGLREAADVLDCGNAGTLIRLVSGVLAGQDFFSVLTGDASLRARPMDRVVVPLRQMGARIDGRDGGRRAPLALRGGRLKGIRYSLPVASAQVKSALLLAGLFAEGETEVEEPAPTRDHTERLFRHYGLPLEVEGRRVRTHIAAPYPAKDLVVPGDFSSAAFFIVAALITPESEVTIDGVGLNPTRTGLLQVLTEMGADLEWRVTEGQDGEPVGWVRARSSRLRGVRVDPELIPRMVDEVPVLAAAAAWAEGTTHIPNLAELRVKESDRVQAIAHNLENLGVRVAAGADWLEIQGGGVRPGVVEPMHDHRIAMAFAVCGLPVGVTVKDAEWAEISFPDFWNTLEGLACR
ncbi:3-phosphoshikimate 1-carboxyvinyltransferase [Marinithermus hydrothermalis]|uniref:3-phosphoshikimate 1-carboxyvinyltransferase n=1 Tax=Marinithermus hydrothermalis (strain DSM 14884 / JCM 11576 / T1) TaxID=869210 RepID=F2NL22_MARHT|nr:3-phosphoshikimate 1-carboxyvinyltransferase [Marinithermus hydrothermalis]AEB11425.1 3-phosphoshikimate 1-carboxyvinyltransferase [Marinithermus hydrothermalis DSM 14884]